MACGPARGRSPWATNMMPFAHCVSSVHRMLSRWDANIRPSPKTAATIQTIDVFRMRATQHYIYSLYKTEVLYITYRSVVSLGNLNILDPLVRTYFLLVFPLASLDSEEHNTAQYKYPGFPGKEDTSERPGDIYGKRIRYTKNASINCPSSCRA